MLTMESKASNETLYKDLPLSVISRSKDIGLKQTKQCGFAKVFLEKKLPLRRLQQGEGDLKFKVEFIGAQKSKKGKKESVDQVEKKTLSNKDRKKLKLFEIKKEGQKYEEYLPLHELWNGYIKDLIDFKNLAESNFVTATFKLMKADLHGAIMTVQRSTCPSYVGTTGIVLMESRNMFTMITAENKVKEIPKQNSVFVIKVEGFQFTIYGNHFRVKSTDRPSRRFKSKATIDL